MHRAWPVAVAFATAIAGCTSVPTGGCPHVYTLGELQVAAAIARGQRVAKPGPLAASAVPKSAPRQVLESDGSYAGGKVYCSVAAARTDAADLVAKGILVKDRWQVYEVAASWNQDVYEKRPGEYRLKRSVPMTKVAD